MVQWENKRDLEIENKMLKEELEIVKQSLERYQNAIDLIADHNNKQIQQIQQDQLQVSQVVEQYESKCQELMQELNSQGDKLKQSLQLTYSLEQQIYKLRRDVDSKNKSIQNLIESLHLSYPNGNSAETEAITHTIRKHKNNQMMRLRMYRKNNKLLENENKYLHNILESSIPMQKDRIMMYFKEKCDFIQQKYDQLNVEYKLLVANQQQ